MNKGTVKVLHFIDSDGVYGAERVILNLSHAMQAEGAIGSVVGCIVPAPNAGNALYDAAVAKGFDAVKLPISNSLFWLVLPKIALRLRRMGISLIHAHGYKASVYGFLISLMTGIPVISTCHLWFEPEHGPLKMRAMVAVEKWFYRWFPKVLAVSDDIRKILLQRGVRPDRTEVIVNGVEVSPALLTAAEKLSLRASLNLAPDDFCIINTARLTRQKAQWSLVEAAAQLKAKGQTCQFLIVGGGELEADLRALIAARDVADCVHMLGFRSDVDQLLVTCDVFALPSLDEGMPMSLLEAAATRIPVVATQVGDVPKLVVHDDSGLIIPVEKPEALVDAVLKLKNNRELGVRFAESAYQRLVSQYSNQAMCERYIGVYGNVLAARG